MSILTAPPIVAEPEVAEEERQQAMWDYYEREVLKAIESDRWIPYTPDYFDRIRDRVRQHHPVEDKRNESVAS